MALGFQFIGRRMLGALPSLIGVVLVTFLLSRALPGDPAVYFAGPAANAESVQQVRESLGLDKSLPQQLGVYLWDLAHGDLGHSLTTGQPVLNDLIQRLPASIELTLAALLFAVATAIPLGVWAAIRPHSLVDHFCRGTVTIGAAFPTFFVALLLVYVFYYVLGWAPQPLGRIDEIYFSPPPSITGLYLVDTLIAGDLDAFRGSLAQLVLPAISLGLFAMAPIARMTRAAMLTALGSDYVRTARASGLGGTTVVMTYAFRNVLLSITTIMGMIFSFLLGSNVLIEQVFGWPGIGNYAVSAVIASDYAAVQGFILMMAVIYVLLNLLVDIASGAVDPRVQFEAEPVAISQAALRSFARDTRYAFTENPLTLAALVIFLLLVGCAILGPSLVPYDPLLTNSSARLVPPSWAHPFGTDQLGRDILSRVVVAARLDLGMAVFAVILSFVIGTGMGAVAGYAGGLTDKVVSRLFDTIMAFPLFVLAMGIVAALGNSVINIIIATAIINLPFYGRFARAEVNVRRDAPWVEAARMGGNGGARILASHIVPTIMPPMMVQASLNMGWAILNAAGLSFIGLGVRPPDAEWGIMVSEGASFIFSGEWWTFVFPGMALVLAVFCFNLLGDGLRDMIDPRRRT